MATNTFTITGTWSNGSKECAAIMVPLIKSLLDKHSQISYSLLREGEYDDFYKADYDGGSFYFGFTRANGTTPVIGFFTGEPKTTEWTKISFAGVYFVSDFQSPITVTYSIGNNYFAIHSLNGENTYNPSQPYSIGVAPGGFFINKPSVPELPDYYTLVIGKSKPTGYSSPPTFSELSILKGPLPTESMPRYLVGDNDVVFTPLMLNATPFEAIGTIASEYLETVYKPVPYYDILNVQGIGEVIRLNGSNLYYILS